MHTATKTARNGQAGGQVPGRSWAPATVDNKMSTAVQCVVVIWLVLVAVVTFSGLVWLWPVAVATNAEGGPAAMGMRWVGPDFAATAMTSVLMVVALSALAGSVVQLIMVFTLRAGRGTLERGYGSWYVLRPVAAALLGIVVFLAVHAGVMNIGDSAASNLALFATTGALAGLFTDRVLQRLQHLLGASDPSAPASAQQIPALPA